MKFYCSFFIYILFLACAPEKADQFFLIQGEAQGSTYSIKYIAKEELFSKEEIDSIFKKFDLSLSTYKKESMISKINSGDSTIIVDSFFIETFKMSDSIYKATNGLFDPTIGVLVNAYGFGPEKKKKKFEERQIDSLLQYVGFYKVSLKEDHTVHKDYEATYFDFNAIAQGYSVDVIVDFLKQKGVANAIVEVGGELYALGSNVIQDKDWVVGIDDPLQTPEERKLIETVTLKNMGMATSGNYRKVITDSLTGEKYVHIINPLTGKAVKNSILSATVLSNSTIKADGYATALMMFSIENIPAFLEKHPDLYVFLIYADETNQLKYFYSEGFTRLLLKES